MCQLLVFFHVGFEPYQKAFGSENLSEDLRIDSCYFTEEISFIQESQLGFVHSMQWLTSV